MLPEREILKKLRKICLGLPGSEEGVSFGHPTFRVSGKIFVVLEEYKGELGICVKVERELQDLFRKDARFFRTPYIGKHGWVTLRVYAARLDWEEVAELVKASSRLVSPHKATTARGPRRKRR